MRDLANSGSSSIRTLAADKMDRIADAAVPIIYASSDPGYAEQVVFREPVFGEALAIAEAWLADHPE